MPTSWGMMGKLPSVGAGVGSLVGSMRRSNNPSLLAQRNQQRAPSRNQMLSERVNNPIDTGGSAQKIAEMIGSMQQPPQNEEPRVFNKLYQF